MSCKRHSHTEHSSKSKSQKQQYNKYKYGYTLQIKIIANYGIYYMCMIDWIIVFHIWRKSVPINVFHFHDVIRIINFSLRK